MNPKCVMWLKAHIHVRFISPILRFWRRVRLQFCLQGPATILSLSIYMRHSMSFGERNISRRELGSYLSVVFNLKLISFVSMQCDCAACTRSLLELKTLPRFHPICWSIFPSIFDECRALIIMLIVATS